jgi:hypothetical protein
MCEKFAAKVIKGVHYGPISQKVTYQIFSDIPLDRGFLSAKLNIVF